MAIGHGFSKKITLRQRNAMADLDTFLNYSRFINTWCPDVTEEGFLCMSRKAKIQCTKQAKENFQKYRKSLSG